MKFSPSELNNMITGFENLFEKTVNALENSFHLKNYLKKQIEEDLEKIIKNSISDNPMNDTSLEGIIAYAALEKAASLYQENFIKKKAEMGLTEDEIHLLVESAVTNIRQKFFENDFKVE